MSFSVSPKTKQLVFSAAAIAMATILSFIKAPLRLPMGGSITLFSMLPVVLSGYFFGIKTGLMTGIAYGLLQFIIEPYFYSIPQMLVDYIFAFGSLGLSGFFHNKKHGLISGYILSVTGRYFFAVLSGVLFFASYAEGSGHGALVYSLLYNIAYILPEAAATIIVVCLPPVNKALIRIKHTAIEA